VSSASQSYNTSKSAQLEALRKVVDKIDGTVVEVLEPEESSAEIERSQLNTALKMAKNDEYDILMLYEVDRLSRADRGILSAIYNGTNPLPDVSNAEFREGQVTVIPTSHLHGAKKELTILSILSYIIDNKIDDYNVDPKVKDTPLLVAVDEAHNHVSDPTTFREVYIVNRARDAVKQGRKDKLGLFMITQNPKTSTATSSNKLTPISSSVSAKKSSPKSPPSPAATNKTSKNTAKVKPPSKPPTSKPSKSQD